MDEMNTGGGGGGDEAMELDGVQGDEASKKKRKEVLKCTLKKD